MANPPSMKQISVAERSPHYEDIIPVLRKALRARKLGYRDLALRLGMSESGVKKVFLGKDASFNRLVAIADALDLPLADLLAEASNPAPKVIEFTEAADTYLAENFEVFEIFWKLYYERKSPAEIQSERGLSAKEVFRILRKLDELGLIELHSGDRVKLPRAEFGYFANGKLLQRMKREWVMKAVQDGVADLAEAPKHFAFYYLRLSDESFANLARSIRELVKDYTRETVKNLNLKNPGTREFRMVSTIVPGSYVK